MCKLCSFNFMEVLYTRLSSGALSSPDSKINRAYCKGIVKTGKEMTQAVTKSAPSLPLLLRLHRPHILSPPPLPYTICFPIPTPSPGLHLDLFRGGGGGGGIEYE